MPQKGQRGQCDRTEPKKECKMQNVQKLISFIGAIALTTLVFGSTVV
jgi:hypothetical protein